MMRDVYVQKIARALTLVAVQRAAARRSTCAGAIATRGTRARPSAASRTSRRRCAAGAWRTPRAPPPPPRRTGAASPQPTRGRARRTLPSRANAAGTAPRVGPASAAQTGRPLRQFNEDAARKLLAYSWPGNVRELRNVVERGEVLSQSEVITAAELPDKIANYKSSQLVIGDQDNQPLSSLDVIELQYIQYVLRQTGGNKTEAAKILGLDRKTLYRKLKEVETD